MKTSKQRREQRKRAKARQMEMVYQASPNPWNTSNDLFGTLTVVPTSTAKCNKKVGKEPTMYDRYNDINVGVNKYDDVQNAKTSLHDAVDRVSGMTETALMRKYGLIENDPPASAQALIDAITNKQYVLPEQPSGWYGNLYGIQWRDPSVKKDRDGFNTTWKAFSQTLHDVELLIDISTPADGYTAFKAFKASAEALTA